MANATVAATRDAVLGSQHPLRGTRYVISDTGVVYTLLGEAGANAVFALSERTGLIVLVTRTGRTVQRGMVRVRVDFPRDTGDLAGTVAFDAGHIGGRTAPDVF